MDKNKFTGDYKVLYQIWAYIVSKGYELDDSFGPIIHVGNNQYEISYSYECGPMCGYGFRGLFWIEDEEVKDKSVETWMR